MHGSKRDAKLEAHWLTKREQVRAFFALQSAGWWKVNVCCLLFVFCRTQKMNFEFSVCSPFRPLFDSGIIY